MERLADFYKSLGFTETFRVPTDSPPIHIDVSLDGYLIGIASIDSTHDDHGLVDNGSMAVEPPYVCPENLLITWVADPDDHPSRSFST